MRLIRKRIWSSSMRAEETFARAVEQRFPDYLSRYGIALRQASPRVYKGEGPRSGISVSLEYTGVATILQPPQDVRESERGDADLYFLLLALAPQVHFYPRTLRYIDEIPVEVERQFRLLVEYGAQVLEGDPAAWSRVHETIEYYRGEKRTGETDEEWFARLREEARLAARHGHYGLALRRYSQLEANDPRFSREDKVLKRQAERMMRGMEGTAGGGSESGI